MDCCESSNIGAPRTPDTAYSKLPTLSRRTLLKGAAALTGAAALSACGIGGGGRDRIQLAFCSQLLCVVPYEVTEARGHFSDQDLDVELVYSQGGGAALQALNAGEVDYAATSFDAAVNAFSSGADIRRFASTGRLPLFALATAPDAADEIGGVADLAGRTVGVSSLGNADHTLLLYLLDRAGMGADDIEIATLGTNIYDVLRVGEVDAGMVQEPALSLLQADGGSVLVNLMDIDDAEEAFGGAYEFMGVSVLASERDERADEMRRLATALLRGLDDTRTIPVGEIVDALPGELIAGEDRGQLEDTLEAYRTSLYPNAVDIDTDAVQRALDALSQAGQLETPVTTDEILDLSVLEEA